MSKTSTTTIEGVTMKGTRAYLTGKAYDFFKDARFRYRVAKTDGQINQEIIESVSKYFNVSMDEAGAILDGQIPTVDIPSDKQFEYDRADAENLFNPKEESTVIPTEGLEAGDTGIRDRNNLAQ